MLKTFHYVNKTLKEFLPIMSQEQIDKLNYASDIIWDWSFYRIGNTDVFHCADEHDWEESYCCWARIRNWLCTECHEHA